MSKTRAICIAFMLYTSAVVGCAPGPDDLVIESFGPEKVVAGKEFLRQAEGVNAMWLSTKNATASTVVVLGRTQLKTLVVKNGTAVTAAVPSELTKSPGEFILYLLDTKTGKRSREAVFTVLSN